MCLWSRESGGKSGFDYLSLSTLCLCCIHLTLSNGLFFKVVVLFVPFCVYSIPRNICGLLIMVTIQVFTGKSVLFCT